MRAQTPALGPFRHTHLTPPPPNKRSLVQLQPREAGGEGGMSTEEKAKMVLDDLTDRLPDQVREP